jgi:hypothetical protein
MKVRGPRLEEKSSANLGPFSHSIRERAEHNKGEANAGAFESSIHLQFALQLPRYRIHVSESRVQHPGEGLTNGV